VIRRYDEAINVIVRLLQAMHLWAFYQAVRWEYMHDILHFISGYVGAFLGCWTFFALAKRRSRP
jgi:hypothetical protein